MKYKAAIAVAFAASIVAVMAFGAAREIFSPRIAAQSRIMERESEVGLAPTVAYIENVLPVVQEAEAAEAAADVKAAHEAQRMVTGALGYAGVIVVVGLALGMVGAVLAFAFSQWRGAVRLDPWRPLPAHRPAQIGNKIYHPELAGGALLSLDADHVPADTAAIAALGQAGANRRAPAAAAVGYIGRGLAERRAPELEGHE